MKRGIQMRGLLNLFGIGVVWLLAAGAWMALGGITQNRGNTQKGSLREKVNDLWGQEQAQRAPVVSYRRELPPPEPEPEADPKAGAKRAAAAKLKDARPKKPEPPRYEHDPVKANLASTRAKARLHSDPRRKGLVWYALYDVGFSAEYSYVHEDERPGLLRIELALPGEGAVYDDLVFSVDGQDKSAALDAEPGSLIYELRVLPKQRVVFRAGYRSRGIDSWRYQPAVGASRLNDFRLELTTDFQKIDFPSETLSPSTRERSGDGYKLAWDFRQIVTGQGIGMVMPSHIQPGELAAALAFSAPVSLLFFFAVVFVLATLRKIDVHPINYLLIAAAFFAFHLLFAYSVDHLSVETAFVVCSVVSVVLVVSYLRLVVSTVFACREAALAQLVYLVGFSLAHFWDGYTGLTITLLAIVTLFVMMQLTGRIRWHEVLSLNKGTKQPL
ncbi:MAG TPA: inner membrane CreD family protein, partial [Polyangiaceae bacterium]|nr:inner membrane CreD family protein [Polyangiaceae bacterium]